MKLKSVWSPRSEVIKNVVEGSLLIIFGNIQTLERLCVIQGRVYVAIWIGMQF